jgi:hypothetical protein
MLLLASRCRKPINIRVNLVSFRRYNAYKAVDFPDPDAPVTTYRPCFLSYPGLDNNYLMLLAVEQKCL